MNYGGDFCGEMVQGQINGERRRRKMQLGCRMERKDVSSHFTMSFSSRNPVLAIATSRQHFHWLRCPIMWLCQERLHLMNFCFSGSSSRPQTPVRKRKWPPLLQRSGSVVEIGAFVSDSFLNPIQGTRMLKWIMSRLLTGERGSATCPQISLSKAVLRGEVQTSKTYDKPRVCTVWLERYPCSSLLTGVHCFPLCAISLGHWLPNFESYLPEQPRTLARRAWKFQNSHEKPVTLYNVLVGPRYPWPVPFWNPL